MHAKCTRSPAAACMPWRQPPSPTEPGLCCNARLAWLAPAMRGSLLRSRHMVALRAHQGLHVFVKAPGLGLLHAPPLRRAPVLLIHILCANEGRYIHPSSSVLCWGHIQKLAVQACRLVACTQGQASHAICAALWCNTRALSSRMATCKHGLSFMQKLRAGSGGRAPSMRAPGRRVRRRPSALSMAASALSRAASRSSKPSSTASSSMSRWS